MELLHKSNEEKPVRFFYQFVTDTLMEELIKHHFPVAAAKNEQHDAPLDYEEVNTLRYTAGYVTRALTKKVRKVPCIISIV